MNVGASERVHRLVIVADREELFVSRAEKPEPAILRMVDVLVFVGEQNVEALAPSVPIVGVAQHRESRPEQQISEIGGVPVAECPLIIGIHAGAGSQSVWVGGRSQSQRFCDHGFDVGRRILRRDQIVLELGQPVAHHLQRIAADLHALVAGGEVVRLHDSLDDAPAVVGVEYVEAGPQAGYFGLDPQLAGGESVEGADPVWRGVLPEARPDTGDHLAGGLVGEGDGENARGRHRACQDAMNDRGREGLRLAGSGAGQDQDGSGCLCCLKLLLGQVGESCVPRRDGATGFQHDNCIRGRRGFPRRL